MPIQGYRMERDFGCDYGEDWFSFPVLYTDAVRSAPNGSKFVELGSWKGRSASYMGRAIKNSGKDIKMYCVDNWIDAPHHGITGDELYAKFIQNTRMFSDVIIPIRMSTIEAAKIFPDESLDFIFVDAGHDYESALADLLAWSPKLKIGGILAGHDYDSEPDVRRAVADFIQNSDADLSDPWGECCFVMRKSD